MILINIKRVTHSHTNSKNKWINLHLFIHKLLQLQFCFNTLKIAKKKNFKRKKLQIPSQYENVLKEFILLITEIHKPLYYFLDTNTQTHLLIQINTITLNLINFKSFWAAVNCICNMKIQIYNLILHTTGKSPENW